LFKLLKKIYLGRCIYNLWNFQQIAAFFESKDLKQSLKNNRVMGLLTCERCLKALLAAVRDFQVPAVGIKSSPGHLKSEIYEDTDAITGIRCSPQGEKEHTQFGYIVKNSCVFRDKRHRFLSGFVQTAINDHLRKAYNLRSKTNRFHVFYSRSSLWSNVSVVRSERGFTLVQLKFIQVWKKTSMFKIE